jgi:hypothetical protein
LTTSANQRKSWAFSHLLALLPAIVALLSSKLTTSPGTDRDSLSQGIGHDSQTRSECGAQVFFVTAVLIPIRDGSRAE